MSRVLFLLTTLCYVHFSVASYCGQAAIPFTFQILHSGLPVLGCARPKCFGWDANGTRADETAQFYRINGKEDGYLRRSDQKSRSPFHSSTMTPRIAKCEETYSKQGCVAGQWLGGIAPRGISQYSELQVRCCWYAPLVESEDRGVAMVTNGQLVVGGEVMSGDTLEGFDYIADIKVEETKNGNPVYAVSIRRMSCTDEDDVPENAELQSLDGDVKMNDKEVPSNQPPAYVEQIQPAPAPQYISHHGPENSLGALPDYTQQLEQKPAVQQYQQQQLQQQQPQQQPQQQQFATLQQHNSLSSYPNVQPVNTVPATGVQPAASFYNPYYQLPPQVAQPFAAVPNQPNVNSFISLQPVPLTMQKQPQMQVQEREVGLTTSLPTLPPMTFPTLDQIPKIDIPSVEDVENVIPPVQRAILTTVARFFGVL
ncbi:hypothetical protein Q1695_000080 [Nippostrongylus brasiliensis]|nr:hypothetical protein Q1695_000080 [Nippostrongylus brasiliensis]